MKNKTEKKEDCRIDDFEEREKGFHPLKFKVKMLIASKIVI